MIKLPSDGFLNYNDRKGFWFWIMMTIGSFVSTDPDVSVNKSNHLIHDFIESSFYKNLMEEDIHAAKKNIFWGFYE